MPRISFKAEEKPTRVPNFAHINLLDWINRVESRETKDKDGKVTKENALVLDKAVHAELTGEGVITETAVLKDADGKPVVDESGKEVERVIRVSSPNLLAEIIDANTKVDDKMYTSEYVNLRALTINGAETLMKGNVDISFVTKTNKAGKEETEEVPSVCKYFNQGFGILARNAAAAKIRTDVEGPDKAIEGAVKDLMKLRGWSREKAMAKVKAMFEEDSD